jgi:hypothetical protein
VVEARWFEAMVAGEGEMEDRGGRQPLMVVCVNPSPAHPIGDPVLSFAGYNAGSAACTAVEIEDKEAVPRHARSTSTALSWKAAP